MHRLDKSRLIWEIEEIVSRAKSELEEADEIKSRPLSSSWFIDGSYALSERQGSFVSLLSLASVGVVSRRLVDGMPGARHPLPHILIPKFLGETRASLIMGSLELLEGIRAVRRGVELVVFDGSYLASLLAGYGSSYEAVTQVHSALRARGVPLQTVLKDVEDEVNRAIDGLIEEAGKEEDAARFLKAVARFLATIYDHAESLYEPLSDLGIEEGLSKQILIDFSVAYTEVNFYLRLLGELLSRAKESGIMPIWVAKETTSRFLSEVLGVRGWISDAVLLSIIWHAKERLYLVLREDMKARSLKPVSPPRDPIASSDTIKRAYRFNRFTVVYFKISRAGPVLQASFPSELVPMDRLEDVMATLSELADERSGYPRPLAVVHHKAVLSQELAEAFATRLWRDSSGALKSILSPIGREIAL